ncbi:MAG: hypothetical protein ACKVU4_10575 [Phycisphaerales bacterium]
MFVWSVVALVVIAAFGAGLLVLGLRGRRIDDHPLCRRCRFDLSGLVDVPDRSDGTLDRSDSTTLPATPRRCPECGANTGARLAIRIGHHRKRRSLIVLGVFFLLAAIGIGGVIGWSAATRFDWNTVKPLWMLRNSAVSADRTTAHAALIEVIRRIETGRAGQTAIGGFVDTALEQQFGAFNAWNGDWSTLINAAYKRDLATPEQYQQYFRQSVRVAALRCPVRVRERRPLHVSAALEWGPLGMNAPDLRFVLKAYVEHAGERAEAYMDGDRHFVVEEQTHGSTSGTNTGGGWPYKARLNLPIGEHPLILHATIDVYDAASPSTEPVLTVSKASPCTLRVVGRSESVVELVSDPELRQRVADSIHRTGIRAGVFGRSTLARVLVLGSDESPVQIVARLLLRCDGHEYWLGQTKAWGPNGSGGESSTSSGDQLPQQLPASVDIVLRPDSDAAEKGGHDRIWGEDIELKDIPVEWLGVVNDARELFSIPSPPRSGGK